MVPELLSPVGSFECLKAAVQNGADSVYFGASSFNARASANNFDSNTLKTAISYAKLRNVNTHLALNILIKNEEWNQAIDLANEAYEFGIDAIIVQDIGLATYLINNFPDLPIHASTQMTAHNLEDVLFLEKLGFQRVVLSRELSLNEIKNITSHSKIETECFIHGALCISYSGRCLFSSMIGARSGNRGKCAQACRLPYELLDSSTSLIDKGYLLSARDLCSLDLLPELIESGIHCFKIEGRLKSPEYVATVTRIYRQAIDQIIQNNSHDLDPIAKKELEQVFNRGGFSKGHFFENSQLVYPNKPNHQGIPLGSILSYQPKKGYITLLLKDSIEKGDTIAVENESGSYLVSELMKNGKNIISAQSR